MDLELDGKVAVVTGASKGIGLAVARELAAEGARVVAGARTVDPLQGLDGVVAVEVDLAQPDGPGRLVAQALERHGRVDVLVNNVGAVRIRMDGFLGTSDDEFDWALRLNFFTALRASARRYPADARAGRRRDRQRRLGQRLLPARRRDDRLRRRQGGGAQPRPMRCPRSRTARDPRQLRLAGPVETDLWLGDQGVAAAEFGNAAGIAPAAVREQTAAGIASRRFSTPQEVATLVALLASPRTANVTGANYVIDGGLVKTM